MRSARILLVLINRVLKLFIPLLSGFFLLKHYFEWLHLVMEGYQEVNYWHWQEVVTTDCQALCLMAAISNAVRLDTVSLIREDAFWHFLARVESQEVKTLLLCWETQAEDYVFNTLHSNFKWGIMIELFSDKLSLALCKLRDKLEPRIFYFNLESQNHLNRLWVDAYISHCDLHDLVSTQDQS